MRYVAIRSEGGLLPYDLLDKIVGDQAAGQKPADFGLPKGRRLIDEISRVWADAQNLWSNFKRRRQSLTERDPYGTSITRSWIVSLLADPEMLGFDLKIQTSAVVVNNVTFAISHRNGDDDGAIPVHIEGCKIDLDRRLHTKLRTSPQAMLQDFLNNSEECSWGILTNGVTMRLLRDSSRTSRPTYLEFDLESILEGNRFNEFALLYRLCHRSRFPQPRHEAADCLLEQYYQESLDEGARVRERLRDGVEDALKILGTALLRHPDNAALRDKSASKDFWPQFHRQLLLLVYRLLFLMVAEERGLIVSLGENAEHNQKIYDEWYSIARLRDRASQIVEQAPFGDLWQGLHRTFSLFEYGLDANPLAIPPLNGDLFNQARAIPDLADTELYNHDLLLAVRRLSIFKDEKGGPWIRVNYSHLDVEELGSVYESLLDYQPIIQKVNGGPAFELSPGMERKRTGSYYTRPELVHELIESALVPIMQQRLAKAEKETEGKDLITEQKAKEKALLDMSVCDPACGSGHFLLAAARRLGKELARVRTGEDEPKPSEFHLAVRDVISHCIYGVDLNPLAVDLCKVALWLEGHWAGKPLSFLDHRIRCGNSLIGVLDPVILEEGVPDDAFTAVTGDEKKAAAFFKKRNKQERTSRQRGLAFEADDHTGEYAASNRELREVSENTAADVRKKAQMYSSWRAGMQHSHDEAVADLWTAQFFLPLTSTSDPAICTTKDFLEFAVDKQTKPQQVAAAQEIAQRVRFFHWHLEFPEVFQSGGFDAVLGNPPWETLNLKEKEFFASRDTSIAKAGNKVARAKLLAVLAETNPRLWDEYLSAMRSSATADTFLRQSGRFPLTARGDINTYTVFAEHARALLASAGRSGIVVPIGIATDETTAEFFANIVDKHQLVQLLGFENEAFIFPSVHHSFKFCALTMAGDAGFSGEVRFAFFCRDFSHAADPKRSFFLAPGDLKLLSPNTRTCPIFRSAFDARLTKKIYAHVPVLLKEAAGGDPWSLVLRRMFHMSDDAELFRTAEQLSGEGFITSGLYLADGSEEWAPLYEAKMIHQFDHRFATYADATQANLNVGILPSCSDNEKSDPNFRPTPKYWVPLKAVRQWQSLRREEWVISYRNITSAITERTSIFAVLPLVGAGHSLMFAQPVCSAPLALCLLTNANMLILDYCVRQKLGGSNLAFHVLRQLPFLPPDRYTSPDLLFIVPRSLELTYSSSDLTGLASDVWAGSDELLRRAICKQLSSNSGENISESLAAATPEKFPPFKWAAPRREQIIAELNAYFAQLYGLTRDELCYILDPKDIFGLDFPSETFRVLKEREIKEYGEYRTQRLVLGAYDELAKSDRFRDEMPMRVSAIEVPVKPTYADAARS
ncbi:MAG: Eco57I restriction-modification methylase domain-containing protein [Acidobacteriaceae bacterium]